MANIRDANDASNDRFNTSYLLGSSHENQNVFADSNADDLLGGNELDFFFALIGTDSLDRGLDEIIEST